MSACYLRSTSPDAGSNDSHGQPNEREKLHNRHQWNDTTPVGYVVTVVAVEVRAAGETVPARGRGRF